MSRHDPVSQWAATVSTPLPQLSRPQAAGLALWSYGIVLTLSYSLEGEPPPKRHRLT